MTTDFIYTTYIKSTPEKVWQAITNPEFTRQYWGQNISDWAAGSDWTHGSPDGETIRVAGKVIESNPPTRLVLSWASPNKPDDVSRVTFDITTVDDMVRLDVLHAQLSAEMGAGVISGWPRVLSSLKSLLETGAPLNTWAGKSSCS